MHIGNQIVKVQAKFGMSCVQLADELEVAPQQLSRWRGSEDLKLSIVKRVADVFGLSIDEFMCYGEAKAKG